MDWEPAAAAAEAETQQVVYRDFLVEMVVIMAPAAAAAAHLQTAQIPALEGTDQTDFV